MAGPDIQELGQWGPEDPRYDRAVRDVPRILTRLSGTALLVLLVAITPASLQPSTGAVSLPHADKVLHFLAYLGVAGLAVPALSGRARPAFALAVLWGVGIEAAQGLMALGREASGLDILANTAGASLGAWAALAALRALATRTWARPASRGAGEGGP